MKQFIAPVFALALVACGGAEAEGEVVGAKSEEVVASNDFTPETDIEKVSYSLGMDQAGFLQSRGIIQYVDPDAYAAGMKDALENKGKMTVREGMELLKELQLGPYLKNKEEGEKFLMENGQRPEVVTLNSGLQYEILKKGNGPIPTQDDQFEAHYTGTLIDGTKFDSSYDAGNPLVLPVTRVIPGWTEALMMMPVGSKWKIYVPYNLGYGEGGSPPVIEPYSTLIFEMELLSIPK